MKIKKTVIVTGLLAVAGAIATAGAVASCDTACTDEVRPSVIVHIIDAVGNPVTADAVLFKVEDQDTEKAVDWRTNIMRAECLDDECTQWAAGAEATGHFSINAQVCGGHYQAEIDVDMEDDGCHVDTQHIFITPNMEDCDELVDVSGAPSNQDGKPELPIISGILAKPQCTGPFRPSVIVDVVDADSEVAKPVAVDSLWWEIEEIWPPTQGVCIPKVGIDDGHGNEICSQFLVGFEQGGDFEITATVCNERYEKKVRVEFEDDGCHVFTERVLLPVDISECPQ